MLILVAATVLLSLQRLAELRYSRRNERRLRRRGAVEAGAGHYPAMVALHTLWLIATLVEGVWRGPEFPAYWPAALVAFAAAQVLRYWAIASLGERWSVRVLVVPGERLVSSGPYRYFSHPNYVAVALEVAAFPLIFGAWVTAVVFSATNAAFLYVRIKTEDRALWEYGQRRRERIR